MKRAALLLAGIFATCAWSGQSVADELSPGWSGFYFGGGLSNRNNELVADFSDFTSSMVCRNCGSDGLDSSFEGFSQDGKWAGHGLAGYLHRFDAVGLGIEGDYTFGDIQSGGDTCSTPSCARLSAFSEIDNQIRIRAIAGVGTDTVFFFVGGGLSFAKVEGGLSAFALDASGSDSDTLDSGGWKTGWTLGGGAQLEVTKNIGIRAEILYDDYGSEDFDGNVSASVPNASADLTAIGSLDLANTTARVSAIIHF